MPKIYYRNCEKKLGKWLRNGSPSVTASSLHLDTFTVGVLQGLIRYTLQAIQKRTIGSHIYTWKCQRSLGVFLSLDVIVARVPIRDSIRLGSLYLRMNLSGCTRSGGLFSTSSLDGYLSSLYLNQKSVGLPGLLICPVVQLITNGKPIETSARASQIRKN